MADAEAALNASRALAQSLAAERAGPTVVWLAKRAPHRAHTHERLSELLVELRCFGIDVMAGVRLAEARIEEIGASSDIPVRKKGDDEDRSLRLL